MKFELDDLLLDEIIFYMENQDGDFLLDTREKFIVDLFNNDYEEKPDFNEKGRFISLPEWGPGDGYRLMESFAASLKNPLVRQELSQALNRNKGVFRAFRNALEPYPEILKNWYSFKESRMKSEVIAWYNSLREEWGLEPIGAEPEDTSSLVLEDFIIKEEGLNLTAESAEGKPCGLLCAKKDEENRLCINRLEVFPEYRGLGLGKTLLAKFLEKAPGQTVIIDVPADSEFFTRALRLEGFEPLSQRLIRKA